MSILTKKNCCVMRAMGLGYAANKVEDNVTRHEYWGLGVYSVFTNPNIWLDRAVDMRVMSS